MSNLQLNLFLLPPLPLVVRLAFPVFFLALNPWLEEFGGIECLLKVTDDLR